MKKKLQIILITSILTIILLTSCQSSNASRGVRGVINIEKRALLLTIGASEKLNYTVNLPDNPEPQVIWTSSEPSIASVSSDGTVTALAFATGAMDRFSAGAATGTAVITVRIQDTDYNDSITVTTTTAAQVDMMTLAPLKDQFAEYFMMGNIFNPRDVSSSAVTNERLIRHYGILTHENDMKPQYLSPSRGRYTFETADRMVNAAIASGFKVHGHALLWHSQIPQWHRNMATADRETALTAMREYITAVASHFAGRIYSWDVLNEGFPDNAGAGTNWKNVMRRGADGEGQGGNPWYISIGSDFVYEGFLAARLADPNAILFYNDYNTDNQNRARLIRDMVQEVNARYRQAFPNERRLLIEGIGMQEHHNTGVSAARVRAAINMFRPLGVIVAVTELDVLAQSWGAFSSAGGSGTERVAVSTVTNSGLMDQARLYGEYFRVYIENADIIDRVTKWGVIDSQSWRSRGLPALFDSNGRAKPAYYRVIAALGM